MDRWKEYKSCLTITPIPPLSVFVFHNSWACMKRSAWCRSSWSTTSPVTVLWLINLWWSHRVSHHVGCVMHDKKFSTSIWSRLMIYIRISMWSRCPFLIMKFEVWRHYNNLHSFSFRRTSQMCTVILSSHHVKHFKKFNTLSVDRWHYKLLFTQTTIINLLK